MIAWSRYRTPFGNGAVVCSGDRILRVFLPSRDVPIERDVERLLQGPGAYDAPQGASAGYAAELEKYFEGDESPADLMPFVEWPGVPAFTLRILQACAAVPRGSAVTYGELARMAGITDKGNYGQPVGQVMAKNPLPLVVPCHRVLLAGHKLGNYGGGADMKRLLLEREDCPVR